MLCKNCGKKLNDNATMCPVCGKATGATVKSQPVLPQQAHKISSTSNSNPTPKRYCTKCGNAISPDAQFCNCCGASITHSPKTAPAFSKLSNGGAAALISTNQKRNIIIAAIAVLLVVVIAILIMALRPASSKIVGEWIPYAEEDSKGITYYSEDEINDTYMSFEKGGIVKGDVCGEYCSGNYSIDGDVLTITAYSSYWRRDANTLYGIEKLTNSELILYELKDPDEKWYYKKK